jgi:TPR repeat protein
MLDKTGWKDLLSKAKAGDGIAQSEVADCFSFGLKTETNEVIVRQNLSSAFSWYEKASMNGDVESLTNLADFLSEGKGCEKDLSKAIDFYLAAIDKGSSRAAFNLGVVYRDKGNLKKAFEYYCLADKIDQADHSFTVGLCLYYGVGVDIDRNTACKHFLKVSADKLQRHTQYEIDETNYLLGLSYLTGDGVKKSFAKSKHFLSLANLDKDHRSAEQLLFVVGQTQI